MSQSTFAYGGIWVVDFSYQYLFTHTNPNVPGPLYPFDSDKCFYVWFLKKLVDSTKANETKWNTYETAILGLTRINNSLERCHDNLQKQVGGHRIKIWKIFEGLQREAQIADLKVAHVEDLLSHVRLVSLVLRSQKLHFSVGDLSQRQRIVIRQNTVSPQCRKSSHDAFLIFAYELKRFGHPSRVPPPTYDRNFDPPSCTPPPARLSPLLRCTPPDDARRPFIVSSELTSIVD
ncbi:Hypothetical protein CINCED_3A014436 [Cinara cedri]|uniref:Uncharacterized protein n=1 Tax=Cinara cedri TaxID=506608 RepID=A0A5E4N9Y4_9HEMI|nr:Hypothetical protein CINCED_3A014436 [Cinara cedri]